MKYHKILLDGVIEVLDRIMIQGAYADKALQGVFRSQPKWGARDRSFVAETCYDLIRYWRLYEYASVPKSSLHQIAGSYLSSRYGNAPDGEIWGTHNHDEIRERIRSANNTRALRESIPDWMDQLGVSELGEEKWTKEIHALNQEASVILRCNSLRTDPAALRKKLETENVHAELMPDYPDALILKERKNVFSTDCFKQGLFEVQDASSQLVAAFLQVSPGMRVIDACAGAGGKALHLACLMKNKGTLISMDTERHKLDELRKRAGRNGVDIIRIQLIEDSKTIKRQFETADRLLLDVPCSGLGVLRRNPDAKWKLSKDFVDRIKITQSEILRNYSRMLKHGGKMVYATCSILPSENENQVAAFLKENPAFQLEDERIISPADSGFDGFYMARIRFD